MFLPHLQHLEEEPPFAAQFQTHNPEPESLIPEHHLGKKTSHPDPSIQRILGLVLHYVQQDM